MTWTGRTRPNTNWNSKRIPAFLLTEAFSFLLQENGGKLQLEETGTPTTNWTGRTLPIT